MILIFLTLSTIASAYQINGKNREGNHEIIYYIKCDSGSLELVTENTSINQFFPGAVSSLDEAVRTVCKRKISNNNNKIRIKAEAAFFYKRKGSGGIISSLASKTSYISRKTLFRMSDKYGFLIAKSAIVTKLKYYAPHKIKSDKYGNFKENGQYETKLIDGYYKIKSRGKIYYVRENERI